jgi:hypothetical protein
MGNLLLFLKLFPLLLAAIQAIEASAQVPKTGPAKLELLVATVRSGIKAADFAPNALSETQFLSWLQTITATIVTFYNVLGIFKKTS